MNLRKAKNVHQLPIIKCVCGFELLLLPEIELLGHAIGEHALEHQKKYCLTDEETNDIEDVLIAQVFKLASETKDFSNNGSASLKK